jgi:SAM-dependent methyltransferase
MATLVQDQLRNSGPSTDGALVSIVIVCYNQARYLAEAIESALAQLYQPVEILVVDDGSTDETPAVVQGFQSIRYVHQVNRGLPAARNIGLRSSTGDFVAFLDADDRLLPNAVQAGLECFRECPEAAFVFGRFQNIYRDGSPAPTAAEEFIEQEHYLHLLQGNFIGMHGTVLYRRAALAATGGFDETLRACEDYELYMRTARTFPIRGYRELVAEYRKHDTNMSRDPVFMLKSVLGVLNRERTCIHDARHRAALETGVRVWKEYYGKLLIQAWKPAPDLKGLLRILHFWPQGLVRGIPRALKRTLTPNRPVRLGDLRRLAPLSRQFGFDRGKPVDRHYIESFLSAHSDAIRGHVLEIGDDSYSKRFGAERIAKQDVLHVEAGHPGVTLLADLSNAPQIPSDSFDCIILTQTLHYIFDLDAAVATLRRILKPGGVVLATLPGISQICRDQSDKESDCWRFTEASAGRLFSNHFGSANTKVRTYGNVLAAIALLEGLTAEELSVEELAHHDPDYQVTIAVKASKGEK